MKWGEAVGEAGRGETIMPTHAKELGFTLNVMMNLQFWKITSCFGEMDRRG